MPPVSADYIQAAVTPQDVLRMKFTGESSLAAQIRRAVGYVMICATTKANFCSCQTLRLMRRAKSSKVRGRGFYRVTDRKRLRFARSLTGKVGVYSNETDDIEEVTDHPLLDLLHRPSQLVAGNLFAQQRWLDLELCGNAFVLKQTTGGQPTALYRFAPHKTRVIPSRTKFIEGYNYGEDYLTRHTWPAEEVDHYKYMQSTFSPYLGMSWVQSIILDADRFQASTVSDLATWLNSGRPDYMLQLPMGSTEDQAKQAREEASRKFKGPDKNREFMVTTAEKVVPLNWSPKDLEGVASRADAKQIIFAAAGVPESFFELNKSNRASSETAHAQFARFSILPLLSRDQDELTNNLLPWFGLEPSDYWLQYDNPVPEDDTQQDALADAQVKGGRLTLNEWRQDQGFEAYPPEIGDVPRFNGVSMSTLDAMQLQGADGEGSTMGVAGDESDEQVATNPADAALAAQQVTAITALLDQVATGDLPPESARAVIAASFPKIPSEQIDEMLAPLAGFEPASIQRDAEAASQANDLAQATLATKVPPKQLPAASKSIKHSSVILKGHACICESHLHTKDAANDNIDASIPEFESQLAKWFDSMLPSLVGSIKPDGTVMSLAESDAAKASLKATLQPQMEQLFKHGYNFGVTELGSNQGPARHVSGSLTADVEKYLNEYTGKTIQSVTTTADAEIRTSLADGIKAGDSMPQLTSRVQAVVKDMSRANAERIARTESADAFMAAREKSWMDSGNVWGKKLVPAPNACPFCLEAAESYGVQPLGTPFFELGSSLEVDGMTMKFDYKSIDGPALHPFCRCTIVMVMEKPE